MLVAGTAQTPASLSRVAPGVCVCVCFCALGGSLKAEMAPNGVVHGLSSLSVPTEGRKKKKKAQCVATELKLLDGLLALHDRVVRRRRLHGPGRRRGGQGRVGIWGDPADGFLRHLPPYSIQPPGRMQRDKRREG